MNSCERYLIKLIDFIIRKNITNNMRVVFYISIVLLVFSIYKVVISLLDLSILSIIGYFIIILFSIMIIRVLNDNVKLYFQLYKYGTYSDVKKFASKFNKSVTAGKIMINIRMLEEGGTIKKIDKDLWQSQLNCIHPVKTREIKL